MFHEAALSKKSLSETELGESDKGIPKLWMEEIASQHVKMLETISFVGIYVGESNHSRASEWCYEMEFVAISWANPWYRMATREPQCLNRASESSESS